MLEYEVPVIWQMLGIAVETTSGTCVDNAVRVGLTNIVTYKLSPNV